MADDVSFDDFYARYFRRLRGFARSAYGERDADDVAQEAMARAFASYARLDPGRDPWPWLVAIVRNVARTRLARDAAVAVPEVSGTAPDAAADVVERVVVAAALDRLSPSDRDVLVLRECHDLTYDELAGLLGRSPNTLRQQALRARRRFAAAYAAVGGRAGAVAWWLRRRLPAATPADVAAAVVTGTLLLGAPPAPAAGRPPAVAAPDAHEVVRPAPRRAVPARPLPPARTARLSAPDRAALVVATPTPVPAAAGERSGAGDVRAAQGRVGHSVETAPKGEAPLCAVGVLC